MLDLAYLLIAIGITSIVYEGVLLPQRMNELRDDVASKSLQLERAKRDAALTYARIEALTNQVARLKPKRDDKGRFAG